MSEDRGFRPRGLGEIAIRCADMDAMVQFYETVIGLQRMHGGYNSAITFFRIAEGVGGHTQVLALFADMAAPGSGSGPTGEENPVTGRASALHHIALSLPFAEQEAVMRWYDRISQPYRVERFGWIGWRGIFTQDPEGNTVEMVAYDPSMLDRA
ncbi:Glyoxalase/Bleomycin resistance protein/Dioxygenase superfamily protein [Ruegeria halocynthiae]|uniref:Glyoxalase/Bleomycin resistance protein/Dioxygenase superfamily protein n=1 Tax=Ruegeria halocynthiae TaxID=985054 RepID=A0A1H3AEN0_9RHOB|nr:VOC family protein [Ruegeria halocynthiae]SDX28055.1 Glyoxalase/Bleomycin resistance protein/Dioxygenase superfamily protein [Ruegeria halocynthiae]